MPQNKINVLFVSLQLTQTIFKSNLQSKNNSGENVNQAKYCHS